MTRTRPLITCTCCKRVRPHRAHRWCDGCYDRWRKAGRPDDGPPPPRPREHNIRPGRNVMIERLRTDTRNRTTAYAELHAMGVGIAEAAARLGVNVRTIARYRKRLGLTEPREPRGGAMSSYDDHHAGLPWRYDGRGPVGADFANTRDLSGTVEDLLPERWERVIAHVHAFARDGAERAEFLAMLGLAERAHGRAAEAPLNEVWDGAA